MAIRAVTFDVYSALFDAQTGLTQAVADLFRRRGMSGDPAAGARAWRHAQMQFLLIANSLDREGASNRTAIDAGARHALRTLAPPLEPAELGALVAAWEHLPAWPEAVAVLQEVRARPVVLAALSNGDQAMLQALLQTLPVRFDQIISTEGGRFKPHPSVYRKAAAAVGVRPEEILHVAGSATDAIGATAAGIRTIWINRGGEAVVDPRFAPAHEAPDLRGVPAQL